MSMREYASEDYGLVLSEDAMKLICEKVFEDEPVEDENYGMALYDSGICNLMSSFTGEGYYVNDDGTDNWGHSIYYNGDDVYYIPINKYPNLFKTAYKDIDEVVAEFKERIGEYLPDNFDYRSNIRHIVGTVFG